MTNCHVWMCAGLRTTSKATARGARPRRILIHSHVPDTMFKTRADHEIVDVTFIVKLCAIHASSLVLAQPHFVQSVANAPMPLLFVSHTHFFHGITEPTHVWTPSSNTQQNGQDTYCVSCCNTVRQVTVTLLIVFRPQKV